MIWCYALQACITMLLWNNVIVEVFQVAPEITYLQAAVLEFVRIVYSPVMRIKMVKKAIDDTRKVLDEKLPKLKREVEPKDTSSGSFEKALLEELKKAERKVGGR
jgi:hypothetical protein